MEPIIGIDLGTTNSEVAFILDKNAEVLKDNDDGIFPSCVGVDDNGRVIVGAEARNQAAIAPEKTVVSVKRKMGSDELIEMGGVKYRPQEISAFILKALKARAEKIIGQTVSKAVITVPAYFTDAQRQATREAGEIAGLEVVRIINEPTAAALAYESDHSETRKILIYDLGGGTFDVSIVKIENGIIEVLSSTGDNHLGGDDFDERLTEMLIEHCTEELGLAVDNDPVIRARLRRAAENAKKELSFQPFITIEEDHIGKKDGKDVHLSLEMDRISFNEMIDVEIERTMESVNKALNDASLLAADIDKIILVGGSTRIPRISEMLTEKFGHEPHGEIDPDLCVALGAGIQAAREMGQETSGVLLDITPYTFGISAVGEIGGVITMTKFVPLIRRNTKLPASRVEAFSTMYDGQKAVEIEVYQGEAEDALDNIRIASYNFELTKAPAGAVILIGYELDINGILKMEATEKKTGRKINAVIENAFASFSEEEISQSRNRISQMWGDDDDIIDGTPDDGAADIPQAVAETLKRAETLLEKATDEDRDEIINLSEDIRDNISSGNPDKAAELARELDDILFYIG